MGIYYSASENGFFSDQIGVIPSDGKKITADQHMALLDGQAEGKNISTDKRGNPVLVDPPPPTKEQLAASALAKRDGMLQSCAIRVSALQDAVDEDEATKDELVALKAWKQYRIKLNRLEQQEGFPEKIDWPESPDSAVVSGS